MRPVIYFMAGGTGGHVLPALEIAQRLQAAGYEIRWMGTEQGLEAKLVPQAGFVIDYLQIGGLRGKGLLRKLTMPVTLLRAVWQARGYLNAHPVALVVGMGGYAAGPGGLAALTKRLPLVIHEQNAVAGLTNRVLAPFTRDTFTAYPSAFRENAGAVITGNPVRAAISALPVPEARIANRAGPVRVLVLGGSLGALAMNERVPAGLAALAKQVPLSVRHQCGRAHLDKTEQIYRDQAVDQEQMTVEVTPFIDDMAGAYAWADFVIARAGAMSVAEIASAGVGALFIPFPHAVDDHQTQNAAFLVDAGAALLIQQDQLSPERLVDMLHPVLSDRTELLRRAQAARATVAEDAAVTLASKMQAHAIQPQGAEVVS